MLLDVRPLAMQRHRWPLALLTDNIRDTHPRADARQKLHGTALPIAACAAHRNSSVGRRITYTTTVDVLAFFRTIRIEFYSK